MKKRPREESVEQYVNRLLNPSLTEMDETQAAASTRTAEHRRGERNPLSKLTTDQVREILCRGRLGEESASELAERFKVNRSTINRIIAGKIWQHVEVAPAPAETPGTEVLMSKRACDVTAAGHVDNPGRN